MKILKENPLVNEVLQGVTTTWDPEDVVTPRLVEQLIAGIIVQQKPSANKIHDRATTGPSKRTFYRDIHALAARMPPRPASRLPGGRNSAPPTRPSTHFQVGGASPEKGRRGMRTLVRLLPIGRPAGRASLFKLLKK